MSSVSFVVRYPSGKALQVKLGSQATVVNIKEYLYEAETRGGKGVCKGKLYLEGKELDDNASLAECGIGKECILSYVEAAGDSLKLSTASEVSAVDFATAKSDFLVMISMKAPQLEDVQRAPIDLILVIDRSGSMSSLMALVIEMAEFVIKQLQPSDRLSIVEYDDRVTTLLPLTKMDDLGKRTATEQAKTLSSRGGTNLAAGLYRGLQLSMERQPDQANEISSVLLFTDGQANEGDRTKDVIVANMLNAEFIRDFNAETLGRGGQLRGYQQQQQQQVNAPIRQSVPTSRSSVSPAAPAKSSSPVKSSPEKRTSVVGKNGKQLASCTVNTFGFGSNHNSDLLKGIAEAGSGLYFFIENRETIGDSFVECVGGLLSMVAQDLTLTVEPAEGVELTQVLTQYAHSKVGKGMEVRIKDLQSEENRDLLCQISLPKLERPMKQPLLRFTVRYDNLIKKQKEELSVVADLDRPPKEEVHAVFNLELDKQRNRINAAEALVQATRLGNAGNIDQARSHVTQAIAKVKSSATGQDPFCLDLIKNLEQCLAGLRDTTSYESVGSKMCMSSASAHNQQRSNMQAHGYSNQKKMAMQTSWKSSH